MSLIILYTWWWCLCSFFRFWKGGFLSFCKYCIFPVLGFVLFIGSGLLRPFFQLPLPWFMLEYISNRVPFIWCAQNNRSGNIIVSLNSLSCENLHSFVQCEEQWNVGHHYLHVGCNSFSFIAFLQSCEGNGINHPLFYLCPKFCAAGIWLQLLNCLYSSAKSSHIFVTLLAVSGLKKFFIFSGRWYNDSLLSFPMRLVQSCTPLSFPSEFFFFHTSKDTPPDLSQLYDPSQC